jgi:hypothetical protein
MDNMTPRRGGVSCGKSLQKGGDRAGVSRRPLTSFFSSRQTSLGGDVPCAPLRTRDRLQRRLPPLPCTDKRWAAALPEVCSVPTAPSSTKADLGKRGWKRGLGGHSLTPIRTISGRPIPHSSHAYPGVGLLVVFFRPAAQGLEPPCVETCLKSMISSLSAALWAPGVAEHRWLRERRRRHLPLS